ncbi:helix-turn-helix domain-containing protein [Bailinhaonella thermotolerans]|uniref:XRE family transcriptional regulator n=1 Tax=Bailinhaonella thermotolerans TaxID=1070861 RepID=A0A3A4B7A0_9ACTN|nr:helix-turn-helix transcriptional regulator [Bailinhaonella thermotolerans]RJL33374.1 XRE family transcriptional regulator [Bailinhaonella thermotolerans]
MSDDATPDTVGKRLARARKRRNFTQLGLAERSRYSRSHIAQVETGRKVATPAFVAGVAAALGVDPAEIYGQPYRTQGHDDHVHAAIPELRRVLVFVEIGPDLGREPRGLDTLAAEVATIRQLMTKAKLTKIGARLPSVIEELTYWAHENPDDLRAWALLSRALRDGVSLTRRLGYGGDALALLEYASATARRAQDPHLPALVALARSLVLMGMDQHRPALALLDRAAADIDPARPDAAEVAGAVELRSAVIAARAALGSGNDGEAWEYFGRAAERVKAGPPNPGVHGLEFSPANVAIHGAAVAVELGDMDEATRRDQRIGEQTLAALPPERRAHHEIDMSRVHVETGEYGRAERRLAEADTIAPQMVTFHPTARSVVSHLVDVRRTLPEPLRRIHARMSA